MDIDNNLRCRRCSELIDDIFYILKIKACKHLKDREYIDLPSLRQDYTVCEKCFLKLKIF